MNSKIVLSFFVATSLLSASGQAVDKSNLDAVCEKISNWKPGETGLVSEEYAGEMNLVDLEFTMAQLNQKNSLLIDTRGDKERSKGLFENVLSLRSGLKAEEPDDLTKEIILSKTAALLKRPQLSWNEFSKMNLILFCNGDKCPKSPKAGCALRRLGISAKQIHLLPLSFDQLYQAGLPLYFSGSKLQGGVSSKQVPADLYVLRLRPGMDLKKSLAAFQIAKKIQAGSIVSAVGSLSEAQLRFANQPSSTKISGPLEIVSLSGTLGPGAMHVHASVSDSTGKTLGGHLTDGNLVFTTAEITILDAKNLLFKREKDSVSTFDELSIENR